MEYPYEAEEDNKDVSDEDINEVATWLNSLTVQELLFIKNLVLFHETWDAQIKKHEAFH